MNVLLRHTIQVSVAGGLTMALSGAAFGASDVELHHTGADSHQQVEVSNVQDTQVSNTNVVQITNTNAQQAASGNVSAEKNTQVGGLGSGNAMNQSTQTTALAIGNPSELAVGGMGQGSTPVTPVTVTPGQGAGQPVVTAANPAVLGAATGGRGSAMLPSVGAHDPIDVSALRALYQDPATGSTRGSQLAQESNGVSGTFLVLATLLSLLGAAGSAIQAQRKAKAQI